MYQMKLNFFTNDETFPFFIQYGEHNKNLYLHSHQNFSELVIVLNGDAIHIVNDEEFYISKGDVFIIGDGTTHGYRNTHDFHICNLMFEPDYFFKGSYDIKETTGFQGLFVIEPILSQKKSFQNMLKLSIYDYEIVRNLTDHMMVEYHKKASGYKTMLTGNFYSLAVMLSRLYAESDLQKKNDVIGMAKAIAYIESHYMEDLALDSLAKLANFSPRHFTRRFYEIKQTTPNHYIQAMRLQKAAFYLSSTDLTMAYIAIQCGFSDSNYFSRLFKKQFGISPTLYRKRSSLSNT